MKNKLLIIGLLTLTVIFLGSCAHRDCQGKKHRVKTNMGGYL